MVANSQVGKNSVCWHDTESNFSRAERPQEFTPSDGYPGQGTNVVDSMARALGRHRILTGAFVLLLVAAAGLSTHRFGQAVPEFSALTGVVSAPDAKVDANPYRNQPFPDLHGTRTETFSTTADPSTRGQQDNGLLQTGIRDTAGSTTILDSTSGSTEIDVTPPLNLAIINGDLGIVELLLANGSDVNARSGAGSYPGETPLHSVAYAGHTRIAELLLAYGANVNATDRYRYTPLRRTVEQGHLAMTELLIRKGADIVTSDVNGMTLLHVVARTEHVEIARLLITGGVDINAMDGSGFTPLDYAQGGEVRMASTLQQLGATCTIC